MVMNYSTRTKAKEEWASKYSTFVKFSNSPLLPLLLETGGMNAGDAGLCQCNHLTQSIKIEHAYREQQDDTVNCSFHH
jgi:hypothetical protein